MKGVSQPTEAILWLRAKLQEPQLISVLTTEWVGTPDKPTGRRLDELMTARRMLGVKAVLYGGYMRWTLPVESQ